ncbi:putative sulfate exporter family transporter [Aquibacillus sp. LR5S19]|uniref:Sulfate exporter family transporter n=1 Tax=Aquibacillus rhizosphaerae TaxID=3051431 RepID=A0ABT7L9Z6_9BACI|nr:putative sulfate exporter family transporter [Aquibacillus sp. LR5S19]MDL4842698.1 putative sulfate exporter family transporter [Aquibacillus sp. LR5S19]
MVKTNKNSKVKESGYVKGVLLTLFIAIIAGMIAKLPIFSMMGVMIISIILGIGWKRIVNLSLESKKGINFSSKILLRVGIILMGLRLNLDQIMSAGSSIVFIDIAVVSFTIIVMLFLGKWFSLNDKFSALLAVGTAICGAAAIVAVAPLIKAKEEHIAISVAFIAILGTVGTVFYSILFVLFDLHSYAYGILVGSTLHELAHVVAASLPGGDTSSEIAILVKMGRVALLIPVAIILGSMFTFTGQGKKRSKLAVKNLPVPWFVIGFLVMSIINSTGIVPKGITDLLISVSILFLSMAMAGLGLSINFKDFKKVGMKAVIVGVLGSILLALFGGLLLFLFQVV